LVEGEPEGAAVFLQLRKMLILVPFQRFFRCNSRMLDPCRTESAFDGVSRGSDVGS